MQIFIYLFILKSKLSFVLCEEEQVCHGLLTDKSFDTFSHLQILNGKY